MATKALAKRTNKAEIAKMEDWEIAAAEKARAARAKEAAGMPRVEHSAAGFKVDGKFLGPKFQAAIATYITTRAFFEKAYVKGSHETPICYAHGTDPATMKPHPESPKPQCETCAACPHDVFGSALQGGGKRCKDTRSLGVVAEAAGDGAVRAEVRALSVPAGSLKPFRGFLKQIPEVTPSGHVASIMTEFGIEPKEEGAYELTFSIVDPLPKEAYKALLEREDAIVTDLSQPWPKLKQEEKEAPKAKAKSVKKVS